MLRLESASLRYATGYEALKGVDFHLEEGEMAFLTGHSGAGKSSLLKLILGLERATQGQVWVDGINVNDLPRSQVHQLRRRIGVVFQDHQLLFDRSVFDNVGLPLRVAGVEEEALGRRVRAALDKVGLLEYERLTPIQLSSGEQQRVGVARAIVNKPRLLLADEPTGNLDPALSADILGLFHQFNQVGVTVLVASHDLDLISRLPHRRLTLQQGALLG